MLIKLLTVECNARPIWSACHRPPSNGESTPILKISNFSRFVYSFSAGVWSCSGVFWKSSGGSWKSFSEKGFQPWSAKWFEKSTSLINFAELCQRFWTHLNGRLSVADFMKFIRLRPVLGKLYVVSFLFVSFVPVWRKFSCLFQFWRKESCLFQLWHQHWQQPAPCIKKCPHCAGTDFRLNLISRGK